MRRNCRSQLPGMQCFGRGDAGRITVKCKRMFTAKMII